LTTTSTVVIVELGEEAPMQANANSLRQARETQGLSRNALYLKSGVTPITIRDMERENTISARFFLRLCRALKVDPASCTDLRVVRRVGRCGWKPIDVTSLAV
jgi:transcriptional regulator with XRE-family HTH domain